MKPPTYRVQHQKVEETNLNDWKDIGKDYTTLDQAKDTKDWLETTIKAYNYRLVEVKELITVL